MVILNKWLGKDIILSLYKLKDKLKCKLTYLDLPILNPHQILYISTYSRLIVNLNFQICTNVNQNIHVLIHGKNAQLDLNTNLRN